MKNTFCTLGFSLFPVVSPQCIWSFPNLLLPFLYLSSTHTAGDRYIFLTYICWDFCLLIDLPPWLSGSIRMSVYAGNINSSTCLSLSILLLHHALNSSSVNLPSFSHCTPLCHDLVFPRWHSVVYFPTMTVPIFPLFFLILLLFVFFCLTWIQLHKIIRTEIAFPHTGLKEYSL